MFSLGGVFVSGRRNLPPYVRVTLALELESTIAARAKENQQGGQGGVLLKQKSAEANPIDTREQIAAIAGVSHDTVAKVKKIKALASEETNDVSESPPITSIFELWTNSVHIVNFLTSFLPAQP